MTKKTQLLPARMYKALELAFKLHGHDTRKSSNVPYLAHLLSVCALVLQNGGDEDEGIAALLHDSLEDKPDKITRRKIKCRFGKKVLEIVEVSTDTPKGYSGGPKPAWRKRKEAYLEQTRNAGSALLLVTVADKVDNARAMLADHRQVGNRLWSRFNASQGDIIWYYKASIEAYQKAGFIHPLLEDLRVLVNQLDELPSAP